MALLVNEMLVVNNRFFQDWKFKNVALTTGILSGMMLMGDWNFPAEHKTLADGDSWLQYCGPFSPVYENMELESAAIC